ncbi:carboxypeptidase regulatory-like domain-containing protein [Puia sp. P3]|uniref:carboxypeptidase-like regulatory domain-containing protein n=1 Tax=Puia sp. P3 TaxID=3423952 RepID=UPI003D66FFF7
MLKQLLFLIFLITFGAVAFAQETTSEIEGRVADGNTGLAGATVTAIHTPSGTVYSTTSRKDGRFNLPNLRIGGPYTVTVSFVGFKEEKQDNIFLTLGQVFKADFAMSNASAQLQEVVVATARRQDKVFNNGHTGSQEIISRSQIERLPTVSRSLQDFTRLTPSSSNGGPGFRRAEQPVQQRNGRRRQLQQLLRSLRYTRRPCTGAAHQP